jgi:hypothetical protein
MKVLSFYMAHFRLPNDFVGGISDALRLMADYHEQVTGGGSTSVSKGIASGATIPKPMPPADAPLSYAIGLSFDQFMDAVDEGKRLSGMLQLKNFDPKVKIACP